MKIKIVSLFFLLIPGLYTNAQDANQLTNELLKEDSAAVTALALYPDNVRKNILRACSYPEVLVRIESLQKNTSDSFKKALAGYPKEEQQKIWDLSRYPDLIERLAKGEKKSKEDLEKITSEYPEEIHETAIHYGQDHFELLEKVNSLNIHSENAFEMMIKEYPDEIKKSIRELIKYPEVINILISNMKMSVLVGYIYKKNPQLIQHKLDSISIDHAKQNAKDLEEWKAGLERNPEAKKEMQEASKKFANEQGYSDDDISMVTETVVVNYVIRPYPYWYGYPWWYDYPYWYPYPYWYDWGFYYGPHGIVYLNFPSPFFTYWYFDHPHHHYYYNHFTDYCIGYYHGPRRSITGFHREVSHWVKKNEPNLPKNFFANDSKRPDRIKEFGKYEIDYDKTVKNNADKNITRNDFLQTNASSYPNMSSVLMESRPKEKPKQIPIYQQPQQPRPIIKIPKESKPIQPPIQPKPLFKPLPKQQTAPKGKKGISISSEENIPKDGFVRMNEAGDFHRSTWNGK